MKILITGCTAMQVDSPRKQNHLISNLESVKRCLESLGHSVEWRDVGLGEDLSQYDHVIVSLAPFASWGTRYMGGCLWAIMNHPRVTFTADDWQVRGIHSSAQALWKREDYFEKTIWSHWGKPDFLERYDLTCAHRHILRQAIRYLAYPQWQHDMLVPCWDGGRLADLRLPAKRLVNYDPSPFMTQYLYSDRPKQRRWIFASLTAKDGWLEKQSFKWPVEMYGNVRKGHPKVPEEELARIYAESWGVLSPAHNVSSAGWFRVRFHMAAAAGCVMFCGEDEARVLGPAYRVNVRTVEAMDDSELRCLAEQQRDALIAKSWSQERMQHVISELIQN